MEDWQAEHITRNMSQLMVLTSFNTIVKAELLAQNILGNADVEKLDASHFRYGKCYTSYQGYQLLMGRRNAYKVLANILTKCNQNGAARILINGVPNPPFIKPLKYLGISYKLKRFKDADIEVHGKTFKIHEFLPSVNYKKLQKIFEDMVPELEIYDTFITQERMFVLAKNTIPPKPPIYIPRFLTTRNKLDELIFEEECPDVFVFKNIKRYKLSQLVQPNFTALSTSQLKYQTSRFIILKETEDWTELKKSAKVPIHLITYQADQNNFFLEDTSSISTLLRKSICQENVYISEEELVDSQLSHKHKTSCVCISGLSGIGKSTLLANIAERMAENSTRRVNAFISLEAFSRDFCLSFLNHEMILLSVLKYISPSQKHAELLLTLVNSGLLRLEIFFDGFDEIPVTKVEIMKQVFKLIITKCPNARIYITARPHVRQELEDSLVVLSHSILPLNQQEQMVLQFWSNGQPQTENSFLKKYASIFLQAIKDTSKNCEREITGISHLAFQERKNDALSIKLPNIYKEVIELSPKTLAANQEESDRVLRGLIERFNDKVIKSLELRLKVISEDICMKKWDGYLLLHHAAIALKMLPNVRKQIYYELDCKRREACNKILWHEERENANMQLCMNLLGLDVNSPVKHLKTQSQKTGSAPVIKRLLKLLVDKKGHYRDLVLYLTHHGPEKIGKAFYINLSLILCLSRNGEDLENLEGKISFQVDIKTPENFHHVAKGLEFLSSEHVEQSGVIHMDIKPTNVLFFNTGNEISLKISDFGISRVLRARQSNRRFASLGEPNYENRTSGIPKSIKDDTFSLGCMFHYVLTNRIHELTDKRNKNIIAPDLPKRPNADYMLSRPILWSERKIREFYELFFNLFNIHAANNHGKAPVLSTFSIFQRALWDTFSRFNLLYGPQ